VRSTRSVFIPLAAALGGCHGAQSALQPGGSGAAAIYQLWVLFFWVCAGVFVVVMAALVAALSRRRATSQPLTVPALDQDTPAERRLTSLLTIGTGITAAILVVFTVTSYAVGTKLFAAAENALDVELIGHRWWWEVRYPASVAGQTVTAANEIHIPAGRQVRVTLQADDVIHSLWVPNLHGKMDLIPGQTNRLVLAADHPGTFRGQCAEFCGLQHAFMALYAVAAAPDEFHRWLDHEKRSAPEPATDADKHGRDVFAENCAVCHPIRGFREDGKIGPDLTHVATRIDIGAGRLPNSRGNRAGWISDAPSLKPGVYMPPFRLQPDDLQALLGYLDTLR
jgi:cytochrome c oxidase subunit 2